MSRHRGEYSENLHRRATVSLLMIVRNEEHQLAACLAPVAPLFDEIVIVDTGSQDATKAVASQFTDCVFDFPWCDDFSAARNESLRHATGDWVLWLDADDRLSPENIERLKALFDQLEHTPQAYLMETACFTEFACEGHTLISHPRLFYRHPDLAWQGRVHEQIRSQSGQLQIEGLYSDVRIDHLGYTDQAILQRKLQRNIRLLRMDFAVRPDDPSTLLHLGMSYYQLGRWEESRDCLDRLLDLKTSEQEHFRQAYGALAHMEIKRGDIPAALSILDRGTAVFPTDEYLLFLRCECLYELDRYDEALSVLARILNAPRQTEYRSGSPAEITNLLAPRRMADILRLKGQFAPAEAMLQSILQQFPQDTHSWHSLGRLYLDCGQRDKLLAIVEQLKACPQGEIFARLLLAFWHLVQNELLAATQHIDWLIAQAPLMPLPRVLRVEILGRSGAPLGDQIQACRDVLRLQPGNPDISRTLQNLESAERLQLSVPRTPGNPTPPAPTATTS